MSNDPTQKLTTPNAGQPITAAMLRQLAEKIVNSIKPGKGIVIRRAADQITIEAKAKGTAGSGGSGATIWYTAETKAGLTDASTVAETALGRVTAGANQGMVCVVNPDKDGWDAINFCE